MRTGYRIFLCLIIGILIISCSERRHDRRLSEIAAIVSDHPEEALQRLDSIDASQLSTADRHFYDFLTIKGSDKAYIPHTSDSLILDVIEYYSTHNKELHPEALYYGARVYSDLGDYPTALKYFQKALDHLPSDTKDIDLKCRILSQTGRLLNTLRLYQEAIPYVESTLELNRQQNDTINIIYELQLLGEIYLRAEIYDKAEKYFREALALGNNSPKEHNARTRMYLAQIKYKTGQLDSAVYLIRNTPIQVGSISRNTALAYASNIYLKAGILDTAYIYANQLIRSTDRGNKEIGYQVILSSDLFKRLSSDSISPYLSHYTALLNSYYKHHEAQLAINQQALYNYQIHERERLKAEHSRDLFKNVAIGIMACFILLGGRYYQQKIRSKNIIIELQQTINNITKIEGKVEPSGNIDATPTPSLSTPTPTEEELREELINKVKSTLEKNKGRFTVHPLILESEAYAQLQELIRQERLLKDNDPLWKEIKNIVTEAYPEFLRKLNFLASEKITSVELQTALLIKCGIRPVEMTVLLGKSNGAIISRRETLGFKVFGKKVGVKEIDNLIRFL
ncbi:MAG: tetratricopeptide repeat protein [Muribaculaceae bacterium]|nr:tetratricopeptide repeat protein [Muribaculaceae bacterium]